MRVLITGAGGQLGPRPAQPLRGSGRRGHRRHPRHAGRGRPRRSTRRSPARPDVVLHAGAYTAVDAQETEVRPPAGSTPSGPAGWPTPPTGSGAHLCYVSTDYVFDGTKEDPTSSGTDQPQSVYGRSKWGGEQEVAATPRVRRWCARRGCAVSTAGTWSARSCPWPTGPSWPSWTTSGATPAFTADLAVGIRRLAAALMPGVFHMTNQGDVSWYEFVRDVLAAAGHDPAKVRPIKTDELDPPRRPAPRQLGARQRRCAWRVSPAPALPREPRPPGRPPHGLISPNRLGAQPRRSRRRARSLDRRRSGSIRSRTARHSSRRGYMAGSISGCMRLSLAR